MILTLPLAWLGSRIGSWEKWRRYRMWFTLGLPTLYVLMGVAGALRDRCFPERGFQQRTGVEFPRSARMERYVFDEMSGPLHDWNCRYEFSCPAEETERLIREIGLKEDDVPHRWDGGGHVAGVLVGMKTDATRTRVTIYCRTF